jgi:hypothetical protein
MFAFYDNSACVDKNDMLLQTVLICIIYFVHIHTMALKRHWRRSLGLTTAWSEYSLRNCRKWWNFGRGICRPQSLLHEVQCKRVLPSCRQKGRRWGANWSQLIQWPSVADSSISPVLVAGRPFDGYQQSSPSLWIQRSRPCPSERDWRSRWLGGGK